MQDTASTAQDQTPPPEEGAQDMPEIQADLPEINPESIARRLEPENVRDVVSQGWIWVADNILTLEAALQIALVAASITGAILIYRLALKGMERLLEREDVPDLAKKIGHWVRPLIWPALLLIFFMASEMGLDALGRAHFLPRVAVSLTVAWIVIRFFSTIIQEPFWARTAATLAWVIAALSIFGLLRPTAEFLDTLAFVVGDTRLSALSVVRGLFIAVLFFWIALWFSGILKGRIDRLPSLTPSVRILLSRAMQLLLITVAILIGLSSIGFPLTALAFFSGALGLGIGFGLQQIFSNLVSGVILLLDRSIKPGDVIQVDETYGYVKSLGLRYASVVTRDNHEHLIPNEEFIINKVVNWSFSDRAVRIKKEVGVAYDADIHKARELMLEAAGSIERVLSHPRPVCLLTGFGDSAVELEIRFWISDPQNGVRNVTSEVLLAIWDLFQEHEIAIPFPQRDLHIKSVEPGILTVAQRQPPAPAAKPKTTKEEVDARQGSGKGEAPDEDQPESVTDAPDFDD